MFADALLDSHHQSRRGWATLTSFGIQAIFIACLLLLPLLYTQVLPQMRETPHSLIAPYGNTAPQQPTPSQPSVGRPSIFVAPRPNALITLQQVHTTTGSGSDIEVPNVPISPDGYSHAGPGYPDGVRHWIDQAAVHVTPPPAVTVRPPRISAMMEGSLIHRVDPVYPALAKAARVQGTVMLAAVIGTDGNVQKLQVLSGHPLLTTAAIDAVRQWRYRPYVLNGSPIEVDTRITVNFILSQ